MTNNNSSRKNRGSSTKSGQKGLAMPKVIAIVALVVVVAGIGYFATRTKPSPTAITQTPAGEKTLPDGTVVKADGTMVKPDGTMIKPDGTMIKPDGAMMGQMVYNFTAQNNSHETGTVTFSEASKDTTNVVIALNGAPKDVPQPAHIHVGSCKTLGAPSRPLTNVVNGKSETILNISYGNLWKEVPFAVNVHKSSAEANVYTACADVISDHAMMKKEGETMMKKEGGAPAPSGVEGMMAKYTGTVLAGKSAPLLDYNKADYDAAIASDKLVVLYFYANWCPICKNETANAFYPAFNELTTDKVVGIRVNYKDSDTDKDEENLARQYGIPYQHTKVLVRNGKQILKAPDGWDKARYLTEINKALAQ